LLTTPLTIISDTRQKRGHHKAKEQYFAANGIQVIHSKLFCGDYQLLNDGTRVVDTKQNLQEVVSNLTSTKKVKTKDGKIKKLSEHERFRAEADKCVTYGIELVVLIEEPGIHSLEDVKRWENPRLHRYNKIKYMHSIGKWKTVPEPKGKPPTDNITLMKIMYTMQVKHGVRWEFCNPKDAGRRVIEILTEGKEVT